MTATAPVGTTPVSITKDLTRPSSILRKRKADDTLASSSPSKKSQIAFNSDVEVRTIPNREEKSVAVTQDAVRRAIIKHRAGDNVGYDKIKTIYAPRKGEQKDAPRKGEQKEASSREVENHTIALLSNVGLLDKSCGDLVHAVLSSGWLGQSDEYRDIFKNFLANLVSAQGVFLPDVLRMLVENFSANPPSQGSLDAQSHVPRSQLYARNHETLQYLLGKNPSAYRILLSMLSNLFPHQSDSRLAYIAYIHNLLSCVREYATVLQTDVLALITERLVKIDLQVQEDLEDFAEDVEDGVVQQVPRSQTHLVSIDHDLDDSDEESNVDEEMDADVSRTRDIAKNVEKMDCILDMLFTFYDRLPLAGVRANAVDILLSQFMTIILPNHRSRHTQFLLFHFVQQSSEHVDKFVTTCLLTCFDKKRHIILRQAAAAYLASFVARGVHVSSEIVRNMWEYISTELKTLQREAEPGCRGPDLQCYTMYYSLVQALLYIFCFRWRDLESGPDEGYEDNDLPSIYGNEERQWIPSVKETLQSHIFSKLNPLKVCSPAIVTEFARIAHHLRIVYVYHLLETNKRIRLYQSLGPRSSYSQLNRETALTARKGEEYQHLDEYFPFDPYHLPKSKHWLENDYRPWTGIPGLDDDNEVDSESGEEEMVNSDVEERTETEDSKD
ncbi:MAG: hypothetical protein Q9220_001311 [cf. Caloplaca sp. 1 TL-2023]